MNLFVNFDSLKYTKISQRQLCLRWFQTLVDLLDFFWILDSCYMKNEMKYMKKIHASSHAAPELSGHRNPTYIQLTYVFYRVNNFNRVQNFFLSFFSVSVWQFLQFYQSLKYFIVNRFFRIYCKLLFNTFNCWSNCNNSQRSDNSLVTSKTFVYSCMLL